MRWNIVIPSPLERYELRAQAMPMKVGAAMDQLFELRVAPDTLVGVTAIRNEQRATSQSLSQAPPRTTAFTC